MTDSEIVDFIEQRRVVIAARDKDGHVTRIEFDQNSIVMVARGANLRECIANAASGQGKPV